LSRRDANAPEDVSLAVGPPAPRLLVAAAIGAHAPVGPEALAFSRRRLVRGPAHPGPFLVEVPEPAALAAATVAAGALRVDSPLVRRAADGAPTRAHHGGDLVGSLFQPAGEGHPPPGRRGAAALDE